MIRVLSNPLLLLFALLLATVRPVMASNGLVGASTAPRSSSESEERGEGESSRESDSGFTAEGRKTRRVIHHINSGGVLRHAHCSRRDREPQRKRLAVAAFATSEHAGRFGLGAPLRI